jgi:hypothetical protein
MKHLQTLSVEGPIIHMANTIVQLYILQFKRFFPYFMLINIMRLIILFLYISRKIF